MGYDIIGDIHGQADKLESLLHELGYRNGTGAWHHSERKVIFVGDFIDRGPAQVSCVRTVRAMVDAGTALAIMGNHDLNAIAWYLDLRVHNEKNREQHEAFLAEVEHKPVHGEIIDWFLTLPLWLDLPGLRVVHACWHTRFMSELSPELNAGRYLTRDLMVAATDEPKDEVEKDNATFSVFKAVEAVTKGIEIPLPDGASFLDKDGYPRTRVRVRWWDRDAATYRTAAMLSPATCAELPDSPIPAHAQIPLGTKPVFFGHYSLRGMPSQQNNRAVCADYGAGHGGPLVAYRFDGELELSAEKFVWVD